MKICICGWYYQEEFYNELKKSKYDITIISNKSEVPESISKMFNNIVIRKNIGLEFGAYNHYVKNNEVDDSILFLHDDTLITIEQINQIEESCRCLDQAYIFANYDEQKKNGGKHGRCIYMSAKFLNYLKTEHSGIPYDERNNGYNGTSKNPEGLDYNESINRYHRLLGRIRDKKLGFKILYRIHIKDIKLGRRGKL